MPGEEAGGPGLLNGVAEQPGGEKTGAMQRWPLSV